MRPIGPGILKSGSFRAAQLTGNVSLDETNPEEYERGKRQGMADVASGQLKLYWQTRSSWGELLTRLMKERFGVAVHHTSDITNASEVSYREGYNQVIAEHVNQVFGASSYQAVLDEVTQYRQEQYRRYVESRNSSQG